MKPLFALLLAIVSICGTIDIAQAGIVFSENFESLSDGNLAGQGGWIGDEINLKSPGQMGSRAVNTLGS